MGADVSILSNLSLPFGKVRMGYLSGEARWGLMCLNFCPSPQVDGRIILTDIFILHFHLKKAWVLSIYSIIFNKFRHICCDI